MVKKTAETLEFWHLVDPKHAIGGYRQKRSGALASTITTTQRVRTLKNLQGLY